MFGDSWFSLVQDNQLVAAATLAVVLRRVRVVSFPWDFCQTSISMANLPWERDVYKRQSYNAAYCGKIAGMKVREVIQLIEADGWRLVSQKGSHRQYRHPVKLGRTTIPGNLGEEVRIGTLRNILRQAGLR